MTARFLLFCVLTLSISLSAQSSFHSDGGEHDNSLSESEQKRSQSSAENIPAGTETSFKKHKPDSNQSINISRTDHLSGNNGNDREVLQKARLTSLPVTLHLVPNDIWEKILFFADDEKANHLNISLTCKFMKHILYEVERKYRVGFIKRICSESIDPKAVQQNGSPMFPKGMFSRYFSLFTTQGDPDDEKIDSFQRKVGLFSRVWLLKTYKSVFNAEYFYTQQEIENTRFNDLLDVEEKNFSLSYAAIALVPSCINRLANLTALFIDNNQLTVLPSQIAALTNLRDLRLHNNKFRHFPEVIGNLTRLRHLFLDDNQLTEVPNTITNLTNLEGLWLQNNWFAEFPDHILGITNLTELHLDNNQISNIPDSIREMTNLDLLTLGSNALFDLPDSMGELANNLGGLFLQKNQFTEVPDSICELTNLEALVLSGNLLQALPEWIGDLANLIVLDLDSNQLTDLPDSIGELTHLITLSIRNNQLIQIPASIKDLPHLRDLNIEGNPNTKG
jgi:Leucine-rich repeat (LRR) protein